MQKQDLINHTLETNLAYAQKLALSADLYIEDAQKMLAVSADFAGEKFDDDTYLANETARLLEQSAMFNSISIVNASGTVVAVSPPSISIKGAHLTTVGAVEALATQSPTISAPYKALTGRLIITLTHPIFANNGKYLGYISGAIYLEEQNIFSTLMRMHFYKDDSYVFVVDQNGTIIYHQNPARINENVGENEAVQQLLTQKSGAMEVTNTKGVEMLAGFSYIEGANWGVVSQRPLDATLEPAVDVINRNIILTLPMMLIILGIAIFFATKIAKPIRQLTDITEKSARNEDITRLTHVNDWYYEASLLKNTLISSFSALQSEVNLLKTEASRDALTNLLNRRAITDALKRWDDTNTPYSIALFDIDKFKAVNDTYGHDIGDEVLKYFARKMEQHVKSYHLCCRYGGEEFMILLPNTTEEDAFHIADVIRQDLESSISPTGTRITTSCGIAASRESLSYAQIITEADTALYTAKNNGRNNVQLSA